MSRILALKSSILGEYSQSSRLLDGYLNQLKDTNDIIVRDLADAPIPMLDFSIATALRSTENLSAEQQEIVALSDQLINELKAADTLIIGAPMYNFTISTQLKNWFDIIARAGVTFRYTEKGAEGLITGKKAIVITTRGGIHKDNSSDIVTPYLKEILAFIGITDVEFVYAEALNMGEEFAAKGIAEAKTQLASVHA